MLVELALSEAQELRSTWLRLVFGDPRLFENSCVPEGLSRTGPAEGKARFLKVRRQHFPALLRAIGTSVTHLR